MKIWFQNRRAKWKRVKAGLTSHGLGRGAAGGGGTNGSNGGNKIVVPIPVHVNRFAVRSQHQHMEKMGLSGPKADLRKENLSGSLEPSGFERFHLSALSQSIAQNNSLAGNNGDGNLLTTAITPKKGF